MAKISTYPSADTPLLLSDRLIGTEAIREIPSPIPLATKNFSLGELLTLFSSNFPAPSLQEVLDTGNTATQDIYITGIIESDVIKPVNIEDTTGSQGTTFQYLSKGVSSISWVDLPVDGLQDVLNKQNTATQNITLTGNISSTYITPANIRDELLNTGSVGQVITKTATGIMWKNSSIPTAPSLADVLSTGNTATNDINLTGDVNATSFVKSGGLSSQFLKADGSVDSSAYALVSSVPTATSDLTNDGEDGVNPFITAQDLPSLTGYVPYTGATTDVDLGTYNLTADHIALNVSPSGAGYVVGATQWNNTIGSSETLLKGGSVSLKNGVDLVARVVNKVTPNTTLTKAAYQAVRVSGAQGQRLAVELAQANNDNNSADTIGIVCETIATNQEGFIQTVGQLEGINTTGSLQGETWADGDVLYLSPMTAGALTNIKPTGATGHIVVIGYVEYAHANNGKIYVKVMNGWELDELHNVYITSPANNEGLFFESSSSLWKNKSISNVLGYTPFNLPSLTSGSVLFSNGTTIAQDNANLFWDNTNNRLGIGTASPSYALDVATDIRALRLYTNIIRDSNANAYINNTVTNAATTDISIGNATAASITLTSKAAGKFVFTTGNVLIGTTTDAGYKLDVNGTARVSGTTTITPAALTGSAATSALDISQTWNTTGTPIALKVNITDTASAALSDLMQLQVGGSTRFRVLKSGFFTFNTGGEIAGNLVVGGNTINASSQLEVRSTTRGFLPPRMTTTQKNAIASPAEGLVVYDTDLKQLCTYNGTWGLSPFYQQSLSGVKYFTDFDNTATSTPNFVQFTSGTNASVIRQVVNIPNATINQIGFSQYQTGTTATGYATHINEGFVGSQFFFGGGAWVFETYVCVETLSTSLERFRFVAGFGNAATNGAESNGAFFTYDEGATQNGTAATPNWQTQTCVGSVRTLTTTSVAVTAGAWVKLRIEVNAAATSITFYINDTLVATHTTNIPTWVSAANPRGFNVKQSIAKTIGTTTRNVFCDYLLYENRLTTAR